MRVGERAAAVVAGNHECGALGLMTLEWFNPVAKAAALWTPPPELDVFCADVEGAAFVQWSKGEMQVTRWTRDRGFY